jgi:hypothetical protein
MMIMMKKNLHLSLYHNYNFYMKPTLFLIAFLFAGSLVFSAPVDETTAKKAGANFLIRETSLSAAANDLGTVYKSVSANSAVNLFYVFSTDKSFVIVAADDRVTPVLAYSDETAFAKGKLAPDVAYMFDIYTNEISYIINNNIPATAAISTDWANLIQGTSSKSKAYTLVTALMKTTWDQVPYYNDMCPYDYNASQRTVTGCVATAMAQVLKYWNYPKTGTGSYSYYDNQYGQQSAVFASTSYNWSNMPNALNSSNTDLANLMYQCGVSVGMSYGIASSNGSAAYVIYDNGKNPVCAEKALKTYFNYASTVQGLKRQNYTDAAWINMLESDLTAHHPIIYAGFESNGAGHCFVFDGFNSVHPYFHINWGWSGAYNGFFAIDALNPGGVGTGGGTGNFNTGQQAIFGIVPADAAYAGVDVSVINSGFSIYPNPASDQLNISPADKNRKIYKVSIVNSQGQEVYTETPSSLTGDKVINTSGFSSGIYFVQLITDKGISSSRLMIQK